MQIEVIWYMQTLHFEHLWKSDVAYDYSVIKIFSYRFCIIIYEARASIIQGKHIPVHLQVNNTDRSEKYCVVNRACKVAAWILFLIWHLLKIAFF